jgi:hypothetical protein
VIVARRDLLDSTFARRPHRVSAAKDGSPKTIPRFHLVIHTFQKEPWYRQRYELETTRAKDCTHNMKEQQTMLCDADTRSGPLQHRPPCPFQGLDSTAASLWAVRRGCPSETSKSPLPFFCNPATTCFPPPPPLPPLPTLPADRSARDNPITSDETRFEIINHFRTAKSSQTRWAT